MPFPALHQPTAFEVIQLPSGQIVKIPKAQPIFKPWTGQPVAENYGGKAVLDFYGEPQFAELGILRIFERAGWQGVWIDTFRRKYRTRYWPKDEVPLPRDRAFLLESIFKAAGSRAGCFDVFCWNGPKFVFAESKRAGKDKIRESQKRWIQAALACGVPADSLLIVEWKNSD